MRILLRLRSFMLYPLARLMIAAQSHSKWLRTRKAPTKVHFEGAYAGQPVLLLALFQKGELRPDLVRLVEAAKSKGFYVLGVNTLKLADPMTLSRNFDCYLERPNYGRDFGSYKTGFLHFYERHMEESCPRLLMLNDSVYYSKRRLPRFLDDMIGSQVEALGSTENFDIEHHFGSFCIAFGAPVLQHPLFRGFWKSYRLTDVRPKVIKRGELELSKILKRCVSSGDQFVALYSATRYIRAIKADRDLLDFAIKNVRTSKVFSWKRASLKSVAAEFRERYSLRRLDLSASETRLDISSNGKLEESYIVDIESLERYLRDVLEAGEIDKGDLHELVIAELGEGFLTGSQIHQNACVLLKLGLPFIKNDGLYRGIFSLEDVGRICAQVAEDEADELLALLVSRPYGGRYLTGWKRAAFEAGLI